MPMIPELAYTMLACARIGAVHSVVFGGFSAEALRDRIVDARLPGGRHRQRGPARAASASRSRRPWTARSRACRWSRRCSWRAAPTPRCRCARAATSGSRRSASKQRSTCTNAWMGAEDPLFILYTSGSTGQAQGPAAHDRRLPRLRRLHPQAGLRLPPRRHLLLRRRRRAGSPATATSSTGPLANGATTVMFESTPDLPRPGPLLAHRGRPRRQHPLHRAHRAARPRPGRRTSG